MPQIPKEKADLIYLCFPNNPTGGVAGREVLQAWVDYANDCGAIILFDAAYEAFITQPEIPHSIFEIPGAKTCAIEFRSFSKTAGFTGTRCAATIWSFFDTLLRKANVVTTPGAGFGPSGEGYIRLTGFGGAEATKQAVERIRKIL